MRWLAAWPLWLIACGPGASSTAGDPPPDDSGFSVADSAVVDTGSTGSTGGTDPAEGDVALVEALVAGERPAAEVVAELAWSGGLPVHTDEGVWFVHLAEGGDWSVAGDHSEWELAPMEAGDGVWTLFVPGLTGEEAAGSRYKFVDAGVDWIADPWARSYTHDDLGEISFVAPPTDDWHLERWPGVAGEGLVPRDLRVFVPAGEGPWPVLYAHDGQNLFDPASIWGGWRLPEALQRTGLDDEVLVVGIDNTVDRMQEYTHVDDHVLGEDWQAAGDAYAALVHEVVRPHVEATYGSTGHDGVMGSSLGGLISLHVAWSYPGEYDFVASLSGTLGWGRFAMSNPTMEERWLAQPPSDVVVYVDSGGSTGPDGACLDLDGDGFPEDDPDSSDNYCETRQFADALAASGSFAWDESLFHWHEPGAPHNEAAWAARVDLPLQLFDEAR